MAKIKIIQIGKTNEKYLAQGIDIFVKRLRHYCKLETITLTESKKKLPAERKKEESNKILNLVNSNDYLIALDEHGKQLGSGQLAGFIEKHNLSNPNPIIFAIGGAYGHDQAILSRANLTLSFSKMTFSHQMIRLLLVEQIYRAHTIIKNEKYHNI